MAKYVVDADYAWRKYLSNVPRGWIMLGTIAHQRDHSVGAFGRSPGGHYAQIMGERVRLLDPREAADALRHTKAGLTYPAADSRRLARSTRSRRKQFRPARRRHGFPLARFECGGAPPR